MSIPLCPSFYNLCATVWFSTGLLSITDDTSFNVEPNISVAYYRPLQFKPYVWVRPPVTKISAFESSNPSVDTDSFELFLHERIDIRTILNVSDGVSDLNGQLIKDADVEYAIYRIGPPISIVASDELTEKSLDGVYDLNITADWVGTFTINITATKDSVIP